MDRPGATVVAVTLALILFTGPSNAQTNELALQARLSKAHLEQNRYQADILEVKDDNTITVKLHIRPKMSREIGIRFRAIDTAQTRNLCSKGYSDAAKNPTILNPGLQAKAFVERRLKIGNVILIETVAYDDFDHRVANVKQINKGRNFLPGRMLKAKNETGQRIALHYDGEDPKPDWYKEIR